MKQDDRILQGQSLVEACARLLLDGRYYNFEERRLAAICQARVMMMQGYNTRRKLPEEFPDSIFYSQRPVGHYVPNRL